MTPLLAIDGGERLSVRSIEPTDGERLVSFHESLDAESKYLRFFNAHPHLSPREVTHFTNVDHQQREALVVLEDDRIVAVGRYDAMREEPGCAEVAFVVAPDHRQEGLATWLLHELARRAHRAGFHTLVGETLSINTRMRNVFRDAGFPVTSSFSDGIVETRMDITGV